MFSNLIESGSHTKDLKRRGKFFIGALAFYGLLLAVVGVGSIYAYTTSLDEQNNYEVFKIIRFPTQQEKPEPATPRVASRPERDSGETQTERPLRATRQYRATQPEAARPRYGVTVVAPPPS